MSTSPKRRLATIDRLIPALGRLVIRTGRMSRDFAKELDGAIVRAVKDGELEALKLLKARQVTPMEFAAANRANRLGALRPSPSLGPLLGQWLSSSDIRESSRMRYEQSWRLILSSMGPDPKLAELTSQWWVRFAASRQVSTSTLNRDRAAVLAFLGWARDIGFDPPAFRVRRLREEPVQSRILSPGEIARLRELASPTDWPILRLLLETGMRQGEALSLRAEDVSPEARSVTIRPQLGVKSRHGPRAAQVSEGMWRHLRQLALLRPSRRLFPISRTTLREHWEKLSSTAAIRGVTLHGIRATFITVGLDNGVSVVDMQKLVGHSDVRVTMRYYRNRVEDREAAKRVWVALGLRDDSGVGPSDSPNNPAPGQLMEIR